MDILIVIASGELSRVIAGVLRAEGHAVWEAADARTAFRALMSRLPDVVLLDTRLPDIGGIDVLRALRESPGGRNVVALLMAEDPLRTRWEARDLHPEHVLAKPLDVLDLSDVVRDIAAKRTSAAPAPAADPDPPAPEPEAAPPPVAPPGATAPPRPMARTIPPGARTLPPGALSWNHTTPETAPRAVDHSLPPSEPPASRPPPTSAVAPAAAPTKPPAPASFGPASSAPAPPPQPTPASHASRATLPPGAMSWSQGTPSTPPAAVPPAAERPQAPRTGGGTRPPSLTSVPPSDAWDVLGVPRGSPPNVISDAVDRLIERFSEAANRERNLDARSRAASMVARVRAARRELLGEPPPSADRENE